MTLLNLVELAILNGGSSPSVGLTAVVCGSVLTQVLLTLDLTPCASSFLVILASIPSHQQTIDTRPPRFFYSGGYHKITSLLNGRFWCHQ